MREILLIKFISPQKAESLMNNQEIQFKDNTISTVSTLILF